jgi:mevalonate kinase
MFAEAIQDNQKYLEDFGIVSKSTHTFMAELSDYGVGKVTGAGGFKDGSGMILFLAQDIQKTKEYLKLKNIEFVPFQQDFDGVKKVY